MSNMDQVFNTIGNKAADRDANETTPVGFAADGFTLRHCRSQALTITIKAGLVALLVLGACDSATDEENASESTADEDAAVSDTTEEDGTETARAVATSFSFSPTFEEHHDISPYFNVFYPEDLEAAVEETGHPLPVVVWGNGGCMRASLAWQTMFDRWSQAGFVTVGLDVGPDGNPMAMHSWQEHAEQIDWVVQENEREGSPFYGKLDTTRIIAAGNSCGGVTALSVAANDDRVTGVYVLSGSSALGTADVNVMGAITVPVGYSEGGPEDISRAAAEADYAALSEGVPGMIVARTTGDHITISFTDQTIVAQEAETGLNWMDLVLYGTQAAYDALTSDTICTGCEPGLYNLESKNLEELLQ